MNDTERSHDACPIDRMLDRISGPWTTYLLYLLGRNGVMRFGELRSAMPGISPKILTDRLRRLEADGLISREQQPTIPLRVNYSLTARGEELRGVLDALGALALRWADEDARQDRR